MLLALSSSIPTGIHGSMPASSSAATISLKSYEFFESGRAVMAPSIMEREESGAIKPKSASSDKPSPPQLGHAPVG